ncbi:MAG: hypothetical protein WC048_18295, partial [Rhizobium sp.]
MSYADSDTLAQFHYDRDKIRMFAHHWQVKPFSAPGQQNTKRSEVTPMPAYRSRTTTHGRNMAGARGLWRAT